MSEAAPASRLIEPRRLFAVLLVVALLGIYGLSALYSVTNKSPTSDEGIHLTAGFTYWTLNDYRLQPENGNLPQRWAAIPLTFMPLNQFGRDHEFWRTGNTWELEWIFLYKIGNDPMWMIFVARSMIVLAATLIGLLVFYYARSLWGYGGGLLALTLYCFNPDFLAHGRLITSDVMGAGAFLAAIWALSRLLEKITWRTVLVTGLVFGILAVSKYYAVLMVPIAAILLLLKLVLTKTTVVELRGGRTLVRWPSRLGASLAALVVVGLIAWVVLWSFYGFRYTAFNDDLHYDQFLESWEEIRPDSELIATSVDIAREFHLLPESYLYGFSHVIKHSELRHAFMAGDFSTTGWWYFFLFTFLVKSPMALLGLLLFALAIILSLKRSSWARLDHLPGWLPLACLIVVFGTAALASTLNIGHRHILPIYIALFVLLGGLWRQCQKHGRVTTAVLLVLVGVYLAESLSVYPHYLTFFNRLAGGPEKGYQLLIDSSLDWGQDLYLLDDWLAENNSGPDREPVTLSYFGRTSVDYLGLDVRYWQSRGLHKRENYDILPLKPGLFVTSASTLQGIYTPTYYPWTQKYESNYVYLMDEMERLLKASTDLDSAWDFVRREGASKWYYKMEHFGDYRAWRVRLHLLQREPLAVLGNTLFIYRLTEEDVREMVIRPEVGLPEDFPTRQLRDLAHRALKKEEHEQAFAQ